MKVVSNWITMDDQVKIYSKEWTAEDKYPIAILQISHGMAEHIERYDDFARFLASKGIFVYGNDHRGHGQTGEMAGLHGYFSDEDGFERVVDDLFMVNQEIKRQYPDVPIFLMGHSMGSFLARRYIQKYADTIKGVIISGTGSSPGLAGKVGKEIAKREMRKKGPKAPSPFMNRLTFGSYNKGIKQPKTEFDWLSNDPSEVEKYINDPYCGFICSSGFFFELITGMEKIHQDSLIRLIPKDLPMYIFSGEKDPVGGNTKGVQKVVEQYKQNGLTNIITRFFEDGRHEMLNERNKMDVYTSIYNWLLEQLR